MVSTVISESSRTSLDVQRVGTVVLRKQLHFKSAVIRSKISSCSCMKNGSNFFFLYYIVNLD